MSAIHNPEQDSFTECNVDKNESEISITIEAERALDNSIECRTCRNVRRNKEVFL